MTKEGLLSPPTMRKSTSMRLSSSAQSKKAAGPTSCNAPAASSASNSTMSKIARNVSLTSATLGAILYTGISAYLLTGYLVIFPPSPRSSSALSSSTSSSLTSSASGLINGLFSSSSEWDETLEAWRKEDGLKFTWLLLAFYFFSASIVCLIGAYGTLRSQRSRFALGCVRFYRDYSIAELASSFIATILAAWFGLGKYRVALRTVVCEELTNGFGLGAVGPGLMRNLSDMGFNWENCELWTEQVIMALVIALAITTVIRLHFVIAVSKFYTDISKSHPSCSESSSPATSTSQRIYILPASTTSEKDSAQPMVFKAVPMASLTREEWLRTTEAVVTIASGSSANGESEEDEGLRYRRGNGRIMLPV